MIKQQNKIKLNLVNIYIFIIVIYAFLQMHPYFTWYTNSLMTILIKLIIPALICFIGILINGRKINVYFGLSAICIILFGIIQTSKGDNNAIGFVANVLIYVSFASFLCQDTYIQKTSFSVFYKLIAISLIPGIIVYVIRLFGISLPYNVLQSTVELKTLANHYYEQYFGSVIYITNVSFRFCGMYDEPGVVGTFCGLLLAANYINITGDKSGKLKFSMFDFLLLVGGFLSTSKAFFVLGFILVLYRLLSIGRNKAFIGVLIVFIAVVVLLNVDTEYTAIKEIQTIANVFMDTGTLNLGRVHSSFAEGWNAFLNEDAYYVLFGHGLGTSLSNSAFVGGAEIRMLIYEVGFVGAIFEVLWLFLSARLVSFSNKKIINCTSMFIIAFFLSMYQRQNVLTMNYIVLLFGGCAAIKYKELQDCNSFDEKGAL